MGENGRKYLTMHRYNTRPFSSILTQQLQPFAHHNWRLAKGSPAASSSLDRFSLAYFLKISTFIILSRILSIQLTRLLTDRGRLSHVFVLTPMKPQIVHSCGRSQTGVSIRKNGRRGRADTSRVGWKRREKKKGRNEQDRGSRGEKSSYLSLNGGIAVVF